MTCDERRREGQALATPGVSGLSTQRGTRYAEATGMEIPPATERQLPASVPHAVVYSLVDGR